MSKLIIAEKPSVAKSIASALGASSRADGFYEGSGLLVSWCVGHLVSPMDAGGYDERFKKWRYDDLPILPEPFRYVLAPGKEDAFENLRALMDRPDVDTIVNACDAGREGELVARWIIEKSGVKKPIKRLWISSQTDKAIKEGFQKLRDGKEYYNLYMAAQARAEADWLVGLNVTRALTCKFNAQLSAGRVQTPTLALLVQRENEIKKFVPKEYYTIEADIGKLFVSWRSKDGGLSTFDREKAERISKEIKGKPFKLTSLRSSDKQTYAPMLYDLTELQRDANKLYGYSPKQTLNIMQKLYEQHKALTYPRTDSRYLTDDIVPTLNERLRAVTIGDTKAAAEDILRRKLKINKSCINNSKVSDHHAIIPTEQKVPMISLSTEEKRIYNLVVKRFLACFMGPYKYKQIKAEFECESEKFTAGGKEEVSLGWKAVYSSDYSFDDEDTADAQERKQILPKMKYSDEFICKNTFVKSGKTKPPARYTEATLLSAMENPSRFVNDKNMKEYLGGGLGTPATRADIIEKLYSSFYVEKQGNSMVPTSKGVQLIDLVPPDLKEPLLTAKWEQELEKISKGKTQKQKFIAEIEKYSADLVKTVKNSSAEYKHDNMTKKTCPDCGKYLLEVNGKKGKMLVCQDRDCGYRRSVSIITNARCPECHKKMELRGEGEKKSFYCSCGYREKYSAFKERRGQSGASKRDVQNYLRNQNKKEDDSNNPFAAAFDKLNL